MTDRFPAVHGAYAEALIARFRSRDATVGVIGLGYVGLPLVCRFAEAGFRTIGFDSDPDKVAALKAARSYIARVPGEKLSNALKKGFAPTTEYARAAECDAWIICFPTPLTRAREPIVTRTSAVVPALMSTSLGD